VGALWRRVATYLGAAAAGGAVVAAAVLLLTSWLAGDSAAWARPSTLPLLLWLAVGSGLAVWIWRLARRAQAWSHRAAASEIESRVGLRRGSVQGAVEVRAEHGGTSEALIELHRQRIGAQLSGRRVAELGDARTTGARARARAAAGLAAVLLFASGAVWLNARDSASRASVSLRGWIVYGAAVIYRWS
jgi:hypothetical protein